MNADDLKALPKEQRRYLLFRFDDYYPSGGMYDLKGAYATSVAARTATEIGRWDNWHIFDTETGEFIEDTNP